ncbi:hypothetical protein EDC04DRAFT_2617449 [Pisolithus marmoratus]|nr:hypothetical protein EDC04DRAFT_2617449 [Pisolithus marmoratus]
MTQPQVVLVTLIMFILQLQMTNTVYGEVVNGPPLTGFYILPGFPNDVRRSIHALPTSMKSQFILKNKDTFRRPPHITGHPRTPLANLHKLLGSLVFHSPMLTNSGFQNGLGQSISTLPTSTKTGLILNNKNTSHGPPHITRLPGSLSIYYQTSHHSDAVYSGKICLFESISTNPIVVNHSQTCSTK